MEEFEAATTVHTGLDKEHQVYKWVIHNFDSIKDNAQAVRAQKIIMNVGKNRKGTSLKWSIGLTAKSSADKAETFEDNWIGIFHCLQKESNLVDVDEKVYSILIVKHLGPDGKKYRRYTTAPMSCMSDQCHVAYGFPQFLDTKAINQRTVLTNGCLTILVKLEVLTERTARSVELRQQERLGGILSRDLQNFHDSGTLSDVNIKTTVDGRVFPVHKAILGARCSVFETMFRSNLKEAQEGVVEIDDVNGCAMKVMLKYIYSGIIDGADIGTADDIISLAYAADKYLVPDLSAFCDEFMVSKCDTSNARLLYAAANRLELKTAKIEIDKYIRDNFGKVTEESEKSWIEKFGWLSN